MAFIDSVYGTMMQNLARESLEQQIVDERFARHAAQKFLHHKRG